MVTQPEVFVSYARADEARVLAIVRTLEKHGVTVWRDGDRILGGELWPESIYHGIVQSKVLLLMCSPASMASRIVAKEVLLGCEQANRPIIPIWLTQPSSYPPSISLFLAGCHRLETHEKPSSAWFEPLLAALHQHGIATGTTRSPHDTIRDTHSTSPICKLSAGSEPVPNSGWVLEQILGSGGFGEVWKVRHRVDPDRVAVLKFATRLDTTARVALRREAQLAKEAQRILPKHGVVRLLGDYLDHHLPCLLMEYASGGTLGESLERAAASGGKLSADKVTRIIQHIAQTIGVGHRHNPVLIHRDLKPANILLDTVNGKVRYRVTDFGIGALASQRDLFATRSGRSIEDEKKRYVASSGAYTPLYASPQQVAGLAPDPRDDVYSLGVMWYQLLMNDLTLTAPSGRKWDEKLRHAGLPHEAIVILAACVEPSADDRPTDALALAEQLETAIRHTQVAIVAPRATIQIAKPVRVSADSPPPAPSTPRMGLQRSIVIIAVVVTVILCAALIGLALRPASGPTQEALATSVITHLETGEWEQALKECDDAVKRSKQTGSLYLLRAQVHIAMSNYNGAIQDYESASREFPAASAAGRSKVLLLQGDLAGASSAADQSLQADPRSAEGLAARGAVLKAKGNLAAAVQDLNEAVRLQNTAKMWCERAEILCGYSDAESLVEFNKVISSSPSAGAYAGRAALTLETAAGRESYWNRAMADAEMALRLNPRCTRALLIRGIIRTEKKENLLGAVQDLDAVLSIDRQSRIAYLTRGRAFRELHQYRKAFEDFQQARQLPGGPKWEAMQEAADTLREEATVALQSNDLQTASTRLDQSDVIRDELLQNTKWLPVILAKGADLTVRGRITEAKGAQADALKHYEQAAEYGDESGTLRASNLYQEGGAIARSAVRADEYVRLGRSQKVIQSWVLCDRPGTPQRRPYRIFVTSTPKVCTPTDDPLAIERNRLKADYLVTLPVELSDQAKNLQKTISPTLPFPEAWKQACETDKLPNIVTTTTP